MWQISTTSLPAIHCDRMAVNGILFHQCAVTEFLVMENKSIADTYGNLIICVEIPAWVLAVSEVAETLQR
jgi:hypothetical protein